MSASRAIDRIAALVRSVLPELPYLSSYRFRIVAANPGDARWQLQPINKSLGLPDLLPIEVHPGMAGLSAEYALGSTVLVEFIEGDPSKPVITHFEAKDKPGFLPVSLFLDATNLVKVGGSADMTVIGSGSEYVPFLELGRPVRYGDYIMMGPPGPMQVQQGRDLSTGLPLGPLAKVVVKV